MGYQSDREEFIERFCRAFPGAMHGQSLIFLREATGAQQSNEIECSIQETDQQRLRRERADERRIKRVELAANKIGACRVEWNGDPRGHPFALVYRRDVNGKETEMRLSVPGRGLPARCFR